MRGEDLKWSTAHFTLKIFSYKTQINRVGWREMGKTKISLKRWNVFSCNGLHLPNGLA